MSALQYKSKIKTPGVELGNEVVLTSPTTGRLNLGAKTETYHTRDNDVLTFDNLLKCSVELVGDGTGAKPSTVETYTLPSTSRTITTISKPGQIRTLRFVFVFPQAVTEARVSSKNGWIKLNISGDGLQGTYTTRLLDENIGQIAMGTIQ